LQVLKDKPYSHELVEIAVRETRKMREINHGTRPGQLGGPSAGSSSSSSADRLGGGSGTGNTLIPMMVRKGAL
jgi:hypothetical protein